MILIQECNLLLKRRMRWESGVLVFVQPPTEENYAIIDKSFCLLFTGIHADGKTVSGVFPLACAVVKAYRGLF